MIYIKKSTNWGRICKLEYPKTDHQLVEDLLKKKELFQLEHVTLTSFGI